MLVSEQVDLAPYNTFGIAARAARCAEVRSLEDLHALICGNRDRIVVLGGGSNVVLAGDVDALVLRIGIRGLALERETNDAVYVRAGAGEGWHEFVRWTMAQGWGGLENLSLIPGTVGAAPIQNIGAYGVELESVFASLDAVDLASGSSLRFDRSACRFGYRDSVFKHEAAGRYAITSVQLRLPRPWRANLSYRELADELAARRITTPNPRDVSDAVIAVRTRKLPDWRVLGNAGSFFKNPVIDPAHHARIKAAHPELVSHAQAEGGFKLAAGWLIDRAGWKGRVLGRAGVYEKQALILVNHGGATGAEVLALADAIAADVQARFGVRLEREPVIIGGACG